MGPSHHCEASLVLFFFLHAVPVHCLPGGKTRATWSPGLNFPFSISMQPILSARLCSCEQLQLICTWFCEQKLFLEIVEHWQSLSALFRKNKHENCKNDVRNILIFPFIIMIFTLKKSKLLITMIVWATIYMSWCKPSSTTNLTFLKYL